VPDQHEFYERIQNRTIELLDRRGKYLVFGLDEEETLIIHLKMSGHLSIESVSKPANKHVHTSFLLNGKEELRFRDVRKFGRVYLVGDPDEVLGSLGPEPLLDEFSDQWLAENLLGRKRILKPLLLDQSFIAGIGNIYADEALFQARLKPDRKSNSLSNSEIQELHRGIQKVLRLGIKEEGASIDAIYRKPDGSMGGMQDSFAVYGRTGMGCIRCSGTVKKIALAGRGTHFCDHCQL
jgi:formamidopyrimidine-DNA glycosylase